MGCEVIWRPHSMKPATLAAALSRGLKIHSATIDANARNFAVTPCHANPLRGIRLDYDGSWPAFRVQGRIRDRCIPCRP